MNTECWLEMDVYWFQGAPLAQKVQELFVGLSPLWMRAPAARKGLTLCVGWLAESILLWNGNPDEQIACCRAPTYECWTYRRLAETVHAIRAEATKRGMTDFHVGLMFFGAPGQPGSPQKPK